VKKEEVMDKRIREPDFVTPISQTVQTIWKKIQNWLAGYIGFWRLSKTDIPGLDRLL